MGPIRRTLTRAAIEAFADAIGAEGDMYRDPDAARARGHPDVVAPPTALAMLFIEPLLELVRRGRIDFAHLVHGEQSYDFIDILRAGETYEVSGRIEAAERRAGHLFLTVVSEARGESGRAVARGRATLVVRGAGGRAP